MVKKRFDVLVTFAKKVSGINFNKNSVKKAITVCNAGLFTTYDEPYEIELKEVHSGYFLICIHLTENILKDFEFHDLVSISRYLTCKHPEYKKCKIGNRVFHYIIVEDIIDDVI